ncbi:MAG: Ig-like domain-containing protein, partial [Candidatus Omnitrophica bacterium]|nr:Ig-like domain-containing protein [Candidatus Omnitrophota bacterium]
MTRPASALRFRRFKPLLGVVLIALATSICQAQLSVSDGLALWLKADKGVTADGAGKVTVWADQSPNGNNAAERLDGTADELPLLVPNDVNSQPAVRFDGVSNVLEIANSYTLQPLDGDWTVIFVAKRLQNSVGDFPQIIGCRPWTAPADDGWAVAYSGAGLVGSHLADGTAGHDLDVTRSASPLSQANFEMWQVEENRGGGTTSFYRNGDLDAILTPAMPTATVAPVDSVYIGRDIGGANNRRANMDLAEVIIYNRVLSKTEREAVTTYLSDKYGLGYVPNVPPTASISSPANGASFNVPATFTLSVDAADTDGSVKKVDFYAGSSL